MIAFMTMRIASFLDRAAKCHIHAAKRENVIMSGGTRMNLPPFPWPEKWTDCTNGRLTDWPAAPLCAERERETERDRELTQLLLAEAVTFRHI